MTRKSRQSGRGRTAINTEVVADRLHSAAIHLLRRVRQSDKASGISAPRISALSVLVFSGPKTLGELAQAENVKPPTITRLVQAMELEGYVRRVADMDDKRVTRIHATSKARKLLERGKSLRVDTVSAMMKGLSKAQIKTLSDAANLIEAMGNDEQKRGSHHRDAKERR